MPSSDSTPLSKSPFSDPGLLLLKVLSLASICIFSAGLIAFWFGASGFNATNGRILSSDLTQHYAAGKMVAEGRMQDLYRDSKLGDRMGELFGGPNFGKTSGFNYLYPPLHALMVSSLVTLPYKTFAALWLAASVGLYLAGAYFILKCFPSLAGRPGLLFMAGLPVFFYGLIVGQNAALSFFIYAGAALLLCRNRPFLAGLLAACLFYKPQFLLAPGVFMLLAGHWRYFSGLCLGSLGFLLLGLWTCGIDSHLAWLGVMKNLLCGGQNQIFNLNQSLRYFLLSLHDSSPTARGLAEAAFSVFSMLLFAASALLVRWSRPLRAVGSQHALLFAISLVLLISPYVMYYDLLLGAGWWIAVMASSDSGLKLRRNLLLLFFWGITLFSINFEGWKVAPTAPLLLAWLAGGFWIVYQPRLRQLKAGCLEDCNILRKFLCRESNT
ncbi:MAG: glycosyltransferase family 87 protein [Methylacidiphilales bacterium]|nr:glycosyltransferase family 87 protein [Candidatus Methylacidiphilales bacterium]